MTIETTAAPESRSGHGSDFAQLRRRIEAAGLLRRRPGYYAARFAAVGAALVLSWVAAFQVGSAVGAVAVGVLMAAVSGQLALLAHDVAHRQVFRTRRPSELVGRLIGNLGIGMSYGWWQDKHTRHHANPNHEELDPDVAPDLLVWSREQAEGRIDEAPGPARFVAAYQGFLFFPLLTLEALNLRVSSVRALLRPGLRERRLEAALLAAHAVAYVSLLLTALPIGTALLVLVVHQALFGVYLGCAFAPNHKGMPTRTGQPEPDFLRKQVLTSRNVRGGRFTDAALGGLNYQIEHHLFPSMPCANLPQAQPIVRDFCAERGIDYEEAGLLESYGVALRHLHAVGAPLRGQPSSKPR
ncbi:MULTISPECIES: fatty acid desaturase family protein [unclassified Nocardioides]|uniref:fatty acid desaturase family protein n=1 Tax=unclassified Nocardioides TaxID=2615069 RepID=UPI003611356B